MTTVNVPAKSRTSSKPCNNVRLKCVVKIVTNIVVFVVRTDASWIKAVEARKRVQVVKCDTKKPPIFPSE